MAEYKVSDNSLVSVADAIRNKTESENKLTFPTGFVQAIQSIPSGGSTLVQKTISVNGTYDAEDDNADGYDSVTVNVLSLFEKVGSYTVQESWENNKTAVDVCQVVLEGLYINNPIAYVLIIKNNTSTSSYRGDAIIVGPVKSSEGYTNLIGLLYRDHYQTALSGLGASLKITQGSVIDIYRAAIPS